MGQTRSQIGSAARYYLHEINVDHVTGTVLNSNINLAQRDVNRDTRFYRGWLNIGLQTGVQEYSLSASAMEVLRGHIATGANTKKLDATSLSDLDRDNADWQAATAGTPTKYYIDGNTIGFEPKPHGVAAAGTEHFRCVLSPADLASATTEPTWCPNGYRDLISKKTAIITAYGYDGDDGPNQIRLQALYNEYARDALGLRRLAEGRARDHQPRIRVTGGYDTYRS